MCVCVYVFARACTDQLGGDVDVRALVDQNTNVRTEENQGQHFLADRCSQHFDAVVGKIVARVLRVLGLEGANNVGVGSVLLFQLDERIEF
jgi:hypothetical protein